MFTKEKWYNLANLITFLNISFGLIAMYFITQKKFFIAIILAWIAGGLDILDGKVARKFNLSSEFGIQLDSFADFFSFVIMPSFLLFFALNLEGIELIIGGFVFIFYIIMGVRRLIEFNLNMEVGKVEKYFIGVPTPLGAILLWIIYLVYTNGILTNIAIIFILVLTIAFLFNSKVKIPHP